MASDTKKQNDIKGTTENINSTIEKTAVNSRYNIQNLKPFNPNYDNTLTTEEAQRRGRLGAIKSAETKRKRKTMRENMLALLNMELSEDKLKSFGVDTSALNGDYTIQNAMALSMMVQAMGGDTKAMQLVRDTIGEKPIEETHNINETITADDVTMIDNMKRTLLG